MPVLLGKAGTKLERFIQLQNNKSNNILLVDLIVKQKTKLTEKRLDRNATIPTQSVCVNWQNVNVSTCWLAILFLMEDNGCRTWGNQASWTSSLEARTNLLQVTTYTPTHEQSSTRAHQPASPNSRRAFHANTQLSPRFFWHTIPRLITVDVFEQLLAMNNSEQG